jgi:hypothetical protein
MLKNNDTCHVLQTVLSHNRTKEGKTMIYKTLPPRKDRATRTPLHVATGGELGCPRRVISSCSTGVTRHVTLVTKTDIG